MRRSCATLLGCALIAAVGCSAEDSEPSSRAAASLPEIAFEDETGAQVTLPDLVETRPGSTQLLVLRHVASWCGTCIWSSDHTREWRDGKLAARVRVIDVLLADRDNAAPTARAIAD